MGLNVLVGLTRLFLHPFHIKFIKYQLIILFAFNIHYVTDLCIFVLGLIDVRPWELKL